MGRQCVGPESRRLRGPHDRPRPAERVDVHHLRAPRRAGLLVRHPGRRRRGPGSEGHDRPGAHVRAHGVQGHARHRHDRLGQGRAGARQDGRRLHGLAEGQGRARRRSERGREAAAGLRGGADRGPAVRQAERVRRAGQPRRRRRHERRHQLGRHDLLLLAAGEQVRAVRLPRVGALLEAGLPRVLQGARRRHRGAPAAHREPADRPPHRALHRRGLHRPSLQQRADRPPQRSRALHDERLDGLLRQVLRAVEPGHLDRRRHQGQGHHPGHRQVLRPHRGAAEAGAAAHPRAGWRRRDRGDAARPGPADLHRGLPQAGGHRSRRSRPSTPSPTC